MMTRNRNMVVPVGAAPYTEVGLCLLSASALKFRLATTGRCTHGDVNREIC
jgi:hypothetical protein